MQPVIPDAALGDTVVRYTLDPWTGSVGLGLFPLALAEQVVARRGNIGGLPGLGPIPSAGNSPGQVVDSLVQVKLTGDAYSGRFAQGHTMRQSPSVSAFRYAGQEILRAAGGITVETSLRNDAGLRLTHRAVWHEDGGGAIESSTEIHNGSTRAAGVEMLSSFSLSGITPFDAGDAPGRLRVHRFRSAWSAEARHEVRSVEELHLERSWSGASAVSERFGQVGTLPVRRWFPFVAIEDVQAQVVWGAQLAWAGSWQMEVFRQHDDVCISGGLADREFGHWTRTLEPGESLVTPAATLACVHGDLDDLCHRLTGAQARAAERHPAVEHDLPIVFNEWGATWGEPRQEKILAVADRLAGSEVRYLVIDAGWYRAHGHDWSRGHGDWIPSAELFPDGLAAVVQAIRERGLIPGLWFEPETVGSQSEAFTALSDHMLHRDGVPVTVGDRRFWNLHDPVAIRYLDERVIDQLERSGFGYLKVDYNETLGLGCDHPQGLGEGLRQQVLGSYALFDRIRQRLPDLVIENCASGGHRLEPSMLGRAAMSSFSDAHETVEIPIIAAQLHRLLLPRQNQIWAVLHRDDSDRRLVYSLAATFLGRMCLSGEVEKLTAHQWDLALQAQRFYRAAAGIIKHGASRHWGTLGESRRHPAGWQAVVRTADGGGSALVVAHAFSDAPREANFPVGAGQWKVKDTFPSEAAFLYRDEARWQPGADFSAMAALLERV